MIKYILLTLLTVSVSHSDKMERDLVIATTEQNFAEAKQNELIIWTSIQEKN